MVHSQGREVWLHKRCTAVVTCDNSGLLSAHKSHWVLVQLVRRERGRENAVSHMSSRHCSFFIGHLPQNDIQEWRACFVASNHSLVNCSVYGSRLLGPLDAGRCSVFILDSTLQLIIWLSYHMIKLLPRKKERKTWILCLWGQAVSNSGDTTASIDIPITIGSAQECMVSLCKRKMNVLVGYIGM